MNIIFVASEAAPLAKTGGLADVAGSLPHALVEMGHEVSVIMPYYRQNIDGRGLPIERFDLVDMWIDGVQRYAPIHRVRIDHVQFYLIEQDDFFGRPELYGPPGGAYDDNLLRFVFMTRVALEIAGRLGQSVDWFHCHDWQTAFLPILLRRQYGHYANIAKARCMYTIHNLAYQGIFSADWIARLGLPADSFHVEGYEFYGQVNAMKAGIAYADEITTVSASYAEEILTPEYSWYLEDSLRAKQHALTGIVNGLDIESWDPATDTALSCHFDADHLSRKENCKRALQEHMGLEQRQDRPVLAVISRLAEQKGIDLIIEAIPHCLHQGYQLLVIGSGDLAYSETLTALAKAAPTQMAFFQGFNESIARQAYAGADMFLMPSRFEPCGLGQLMAMRYGVAPIARATGGLRDTIIDVSAYPYQGTGFLFNDAYLEAFIDAIERAVSVWKNPEHWQHILQRGMRRDSSWAASAALYSRLYQGDRS